MVSDVPADQKKALVYEAFGYAEKALEKDDACFASHKVSKAHPPHHLCVLPLMVIIDNSKIMLNLSGWWVRHVRKKQTST